MAFDDQAMTTSNPVQSFYGVWDAGSSMTATAGTAATGRLTKATLVAQTFINESQVSNHPVNYLTRSNDAKLGWYIDLVIPNSTLFLGARVVVKPLLLGDILFFIVTGSSGSVCGGSRTSHLITLDAYSGTTADFNVYDTDSDGRADDQAPVTSLPPEVVGLGSVEDKLIITAEGEVSVRKVTVTRFIPPGAKTRGIIR